jgi:hypothetical protein
MPSGVGLAFTLLSLLFAWLLWQGRGREGDAAGNGGEPRWRLRLRSAIPPLLLIISLPSGCANERFDSLRLFARSMSVTQVQMQGGRPQAIAAPGCDAYFRASDSAVFVIGRARGCVDLVVQDPNGPPVDGAVVRLDHRQGGDAALRLATLAGDGGAVVAAQDGPDGRTFAGAVPLTEGDQICIKSCGGAQASWWVFRNGGLAPAAGGEARALQVREGPYGWLRPYGPTDRIHRLGSLLCARPEADGSCGSPVLADSARAGEAGKPALSFLFQTGGVGGGDWQAMLLDPGAAIRRAGGELVRPNLVVTQPLAQGGSRHIALLGLRGNALRELRSFTLAHDFTTAPAPQRTFRLTLDTPEMIPIGNCAEPLSRLAVSPEQLSPEAFSISAFGNRPNSVLASAAAGLPISRFDLCRSTSFAFSSPLDRPAGDNMGGPERRQVQFDVDRMAIPWLLVMLAAAVALVVHAASERLWQDNRLDGQVLAVTQYLLVLRAIIGVEGVFNDSAIDWRLIFGDAGTALVVLPMILVAARRRSETSVMTLLSLAGFTILALASLWWWLGPPDLIGKFLSALALAALAVRAVTLRFARSSPVEREDEGGGLATSEEEVPGGIWIVPKRDLPAVHAPARPLQPPTTSGRNFFRWRIGIDSPPNFWPFLLALIVGGRILLGLLGYRERIFGIALSAVYVPLLLLVVAAILAQAEADPQRRRRLGLMFLGALAIGAGLVALIINDIGFALVHVPPIAGVALWRLMRWGKGDGGERPGRTTSLLWAAPVGALVAGYFALWALVAFTPPPSDSAPLEDRVAYAVADRSTDPNWLRLRAVFAPDQIPRIGNRASAIQLDQSLLLGELTGTLFGRGWLTPVDLGTFRWQATHLSDYLSASHVMAPFGRAGALALLLVLAAFAGAAVARRAPPPASWPNLAGTLAVWTLFGAAAYMVLANLLLVPFTGRNIYLLSASSGGDLMEGLILLLMARIGLAYRRSA